MQNKKFIFSGIERLYGKQATEAFKNSKIIIAGIGGVGSWAAESLTRSGIGNLDLIDLDDICITNINRQIHALISTVGQSKVLVMKQRLEQINPKIKINPIENFLTPENIAETIDTTADLIIDCTDDIKTKAALINYSKIKKIKLITIGGAGGKKDPTQIDVCDLSRTINDPLASKLRKILRKEYNFPTKYKNKFKIDCVYSKECITHPQLDEQETSKENQSTKMDCQSGFGSITNVTASFGFVAAAKALDQIISIRQ